MTINSIIKRTTERNVAIIIDGVNEKIDEEYYNESLKESLDKFWQAGILAGVTQTTYHIGKELIITFSGEPTRIDSLLKHLNNES